MVLKAIAAALCALAVLGVRPGMTPAQFGVADLGAVVAEFVGADAGLGYLIQTFMAFFRTPLAFAAVLMLAVMGVLLFQAVTLAERLLFPWSSGAGHANPGI